MSEIDRRIKQYLIFRLLIILLGFGLVAFDHLCPGPGFSESSSRFLYCLLGGYLTFGVGILVVPRQARGKPAAVRWQVLGDLLFQSLLIWGTGGVFSIFSPLLLVTLVAATSVTSARGAMFLATAATLLVTAVTVAHALGVAPSAASRLGWPHTSGDVVYLTSYLLGSILALYAVSALGSRFSHGLRSMQSLQSAILEGMAEGLIGVARDGRIVQLNREARSLLGLEGPRGGAWLTLERLFPGERHAVLRGAFLDERRRRVATSILVDGTRERPVDVKISSVVDDGGMPLCRIGILSDMTLQREVEASERRIQKLKDLQVMALGLAHEIRNPLASIRGCVQEISRVVRGSPQVERCMDIVCRESDRLDRIIEEFLLYARSGPVDLVALDLLGVIEEAILLLRARPSFGARTIALSPTAGRPRIFGDRNRLMQVFLNLGLNAVDATTARGKITIELRPRRFAALEAGNPERELVEGVEVRFSDDGKGMEEGDMKRIFTPFFTTKASGNGLGLCIVDRIVREHNGVLDVSSAPGQGATFRLGFPVLPASGPGTPGPATAGAEGNPVNEELEHCCHA